MQMLQQVFDSEDELGGGGEDDSPKPRRRGSKKQQEDSDFEVGGFLGKDRFSCFSCLHAPTCLLVQIVLLDTCSYDVAAAWHSTPPLVELPSAVSLACRSTQHIVW